MCVYLSRLEEENGSVLLVAVMLLSLLTLIGIFATTTSDTEINIAANDRLHKLAFYNADGMTNVGTELLELNIACPEGFTEDPPGSGQVVIENNTMVVSQLMFWDKELDMTVPDYPTPYLPSDSNRVAYDPNGYVNQPHTNLNIVGKPVFSTGSAIQIAAGYEGKGKGAAGSGAYVAYDIYAQYVGTQNSQSIVGLEWAHLIGQEGSCAY